MCDAIFSVILMQEPERRVHGERCVWKGRGIKRKCVSEEDCVMYAPILQTLQMFLKNEAVVLAVCLAYCICLLKLRVHIYI